VLPWKTAVDFELVPPVAPPRISRAHQSEYWEELHPIKFRHEANDDHLSRSFGISTPVFGTEVEKPISVYKELTKLQKDDHA